MNYEQFLQQKHIVVTPSGLDTLPELNPYLKPFQKSIVAWSLRQGRCAVFASTGMGKTLMSLNFARVVANHEQGKVLWLSPLAVAEQTVQEAVKFDIPGVSYATDYRHVKSDIVVTNYERFDHFNVNDFCGVVLDESAIIKSQDGATRQLLTEKCIKIKWKLCATATPAPNDYVELGSHAEFLGVMSAKEMLATFFVKDDSTRMEGEAQYRLKRHGIKPFWHWLASWSVMIRRPEDLGFHAPEYDLPPLTFKRLRVDADVEPPSGEFFAARARTLRDRIKARRTTLSQRVDQVINIVKAEPDRPFLIWCNLNDEANALEKAIPKALQVTGSHSIETKVSRLLGFKMGDPLILISKPSLAAHGLNYQNCSRVVFVGLSDSFELTYQAIRRCWRFGQKEEVIVYFVSSDIEGAVAENLKRKEREFEAMLDAMSEHMIDIMRENVGGAVHRKETYDPQMDMVLPQWLQEF